MTEKEQARITAKAAVFQPMAEIMQTHVIARQARPQHVFCSVAEIAQQRATRFRRVPPFVPLLIFSKRMGKAQIVSLICLRAR